MNKITFPPKHEIVYLKGVENYTEVYLATGRKLISSYTLLRHQEKLDGFLRVSKSHLLNPLFVAEVCTVGFAREVHLKSGMRVKVSRRRKKIVNYIM